MFLQRHQRAALTTLTAVLAVYLAAANAALAQKAKPGPVPAYVLTDLGAGHAEELTFPDADGVVLVAGSAYTPQAAPSGPQAWLWEADAVTGTILGASSLARESSDAWSINDSGLVIGDSSPLRGEFVYVPGVGLVLVNEARFLRTINNAGDIVGSTLTEGALWHVDAAGNVTGPVLLGAFFPEDINDWGLMAGYQSEQVSENEWITHAAIAWFDAGVLQVLELQDLVAGFGGSASAVNNLGQVVGRCASNSKVRATLWNTPTSAPIDLGSLPGASDYPSLATAINDNGQVVGASQGRAFLWQNGTLSDLNDLAGINGKGEKKLQIAQGINNTGHIVGAMWVRNGGQHGFLLARMP